ncbi:disintegrin and metalloproteinase domain-containing protein 10 [Trichonephila clavata]|uniref:Disintegrin and metalloproteinase domain-containing protein 10 n=1 Tax=Trichonephila clavata TaxID=2740835 RepID=A0A8X6H3T1_TRICU|nr:disintegrin and metalloproteinase domain-containing protein 10 [Trichonephila clavata]
MHLKHTYGPDIKAYEIINPVIKEANANRNTHPVKDNKFDKEFDAEVQFRAFNKSFHLLLYKDLQFQKVRIESYRSFKSSEHYKASSNFYEGTLKDSGFDSRVSGYIENGIFSGIIAENGTVYFLESADLFFHNFIHSGNIVIYESADITNFEEYQDFRDNENEPLKKNMFLYRNKLDEYYFKGINRTLKPGEHYACRIEMVADHTLYEYFNKNVYVVSAFLYLHAKYADSVFRRTDFDGTGVPNNIRIVVEKIYIYESLNDPNYPMAKASSLFDFLSKFARRTQYFCLSICMCYRRYSSRAVGNAYKPTTGIHGLPGGICQEPLYFRLDGFKYVKMNFNTAVVTIIGTNRKVLPLITTLLAITHEIGHSFGSDHDSPTNLFCSPGGEKGHYIMHPTTTKKLKELSNVFSLCSRRAMYKIIAERGNCLKVYPSTCGNGIREGNEECDCGWEKICKYLDPCCTPFDAKAPEKGCTFRNKTGAVCSPKESPCCNKDCTVNRQKDKICYESDTSCFISYCDQNSAVCPAPEKARDAYPCLKSSKTCHKGFCNSSVCLDNNLEECKCKEWHYFCFVCCLKDKKCIPAHNIGFLTPWNSPFVLVEGTPCNGSKHNRCDGTGRCINVKTRVEVDTGEKAIWWALAILVLVVLVLLLIFIYLLIKHLK